MNETNEPNVIPRSELSALRDTACFIRMSYMQKN